MISGKPVKSEIERTSMPASWSSCAVPPVETTSMPRSVRPRANSTMPRLSETDSSARPTRTSPGRAKCELTAVSATGPRLSGDPHATGVGRVQAQCAAGEEADRLRQQLVLQRAQALVYRVAVGGVGQ